MDTDIEIESTAATKIAEEAIKIGAVDKREEEEKIFKVFFSTLIKARSPEHGMVRLQEMMDNLKETNCKNEFKFREVDLEESENIEIVFNGTK